MKKIAAFLIIVISFASANATDYDILKESSDSNNLPLVERTLQAILHTENIPNVKAWIKCGDIFSESGKLFAALNIYNIAQVKFELLMDIFEPEELKLDEKEIEKDIKTKINDLNKKLGISSKSKFFNFDDEQAIGDQDYYKYLAETIKINDDSAKTMLPLPYVVSDLAATIEEHLEEYAEMNEEMMEMEGEYDEYDNGEYDEAAEENDEEEVEIYPGPNDSPDVDSDPEIDLDELFKSIVYPAKAKKQKIEGIVIVNVLVDRKGKPVRCEIIESDSKLLNQAAIDAIMKATFTPALLDGEPLACWIGIPVEFKIK